MQTLNFNITQTIYREWTSRCSRLLMVLNRGERISRFSQISNANVLIKEGFILSLNNATLFCLLNLVDLQNFPNYLNSKWHALWSVYVSPNPNPVYRDKSLSDISIILFPEMWYLSDQYRLTCVFVIIILPFKKVLPHWDGFSRIFLNPVIYC